MFILWINIYKGGVFLKKLIKNKFFIISIGVIILIIIYLFAQKVIDDYFFNTNNDILIEEESLNEDLIVEKTDKSESDNKNIETSEVNQENEKKDKEEIEVKKIYVYITGEVNNPGVVILNEGSRIVDAINAAGGTTSKANVAKVNLVFVLEDGMKVNIPSNSDLKNDSDFEYITLNSGDGRDDNYTSNNAASENKNNLKNYEVVNINIATQTELETLPGIGPSIALKIINYRKENGKFSSIDEIKNVNGIGENKFEKIKVHITI